MSEELNHIRYTAVFHGLGSDMQQRLVKWKRMLNQMEEEAKKFKRMKKSCSAKDIDIIDKDVPRSLHTLYLDDDIKEGKQTQLGNMLKDYFGFYKNGSYYQGLNDVAGFLLNIFPEHEALIVLEGIDRRFLFDFIYLPFSDCLVPILNSIQDVIMWKRPKAEKDIVSMIANSNPP